jgi:hypothetical protein
MIRVNLYNFYDGRDKEEFINLYKFIFSQEGDVFEILLPTNWGMAYYNYGYSAYAGEILSEIAESFEYFVPKKGLKQALFFRIEVSDKEKLVDVLHYILQGYGGGRDDLKYCYAAIEYWNAVYEGEKESVCIDILKKLDEELEKEEKESDLKRGGSEGMINVE